MLSFPAPPCSTSAPPPPMMVSAPPRPSTAEGSEVPERFTLSFPSPAWTAIFLTLLKVALPPFILTVTELPDPLTTIESLPAVPVMIRVRALSTKALTLPPLPLTLPVIAKLKGFSSPSLLEMVTLPLLVPAEEESRRMVRVSLAPGAMVLPRPSVTLKPEGTVTPLMRRVPPPLLVTRKLMLLVEPPAVTEPKLTALVAPSRISLEPSKTAMSAAEGGGGGGGGVELVTVPRRLIVMERAPVPMVSEPLLMPAELVSMRMLKVELLWGPMAPAGPLLIMKPDGARTLPIDNLPVPSLRTVKVIALALLPRATLGKLMVLPLPRRLPPRIRVSLATLGRPTEPFTLITNGFSLESLLLTRTDPLAAPALLVSRRIVNESLWPAPRLEGRPSTTANPRGTKMPPRLSVPLPSLRTVKILLGALPLSVALPNLMVPPPLLRLRPPSRMVISALLGGGA